MVDTAVIVGNGSIRDYTLYYKYFEGAGMVICADGGASHVRKLGLKPDVVLGDLDSINPSDFDYFKEKGVRLFKFPVEKDMTDTELAAQYAIEQGYRRLILIGGLGTRWDHSLANVFLLKKLLDKGVEGLIVDEQNEIMVIKDSVLLQRDKYTNITLLPLSEKVEGVTTQGLYYPLKDASMDIGSTLGVSNQFTGEQARVSIKDGILIVIKTCD